MTQNLEIKLDSKYEFCIIKTNASNRHLFLLLNIHAPARKSSRYPVNIDFYIDLK